MAANRDDDEELLLPDNRTAWEAALSGTSDRLWGLDTDAIRRQRRPDLCTAAWLPLLGWERSVHYWSEGDEAANRARTGTSFEDHLAYGSPEALEAEIAQDVGHPVQLREYFEVPGGAWPDFYVDLALDQARPETWPTLDAVMTSAVRRKNVRDWPTVRMMIPSQGPSFLGASGSIGGVIRSAPLDDTPRSAVGAWIGAFASVSGIITSRPVTA